MNLPNGDQAIVDIRKLLDYSLNLQHPRGSNKARVFAAAGIQKADAEELQAALLSAAPEREAQPGPCQHLRPTLHRLRPTLHR